MQPAEHDPVLDAALETLTRQGFWPGQSEVCIILGSGLGAIEELCKSQAQIDYVNVPGFARPAGISGHVCRLTQGVLWGRKTLVFRGRYHAYEGHTPRELVFPIRVAHALGCKTAMLTNAAGGLRDDLEPGTMMAIRDHMNLMGVNPLVGRQRMSGATAFAPIAGAYDMRLMGALTSAQEKAGERSASGVYAAVLGPSFETFAEVEMLKRLGADAVGMSTVPEVICARALGLRVAGLSLITNRAGSAFDSHAQTLFEGEKRLGRMIKVLEGLFGAM